MIVAGDTFSLALSSADYRAADGWAAKLRLTPRAASPSATIDLTATSTAEGFRFSATASATDSWPPGAYTAATWVERAGEVHTLNTWQETILPDPRQLPAGTDTRSLPRKTLDDLLAARAQWAATQGRTRRYKIGDREREFASAAELNQEIEFWQGQLAAELQAERLAAGLKPRNRILTRFSRPR